MSWDIVVQDLPRGISSVSEIPSDFRPVPLGPRAELIRRIRAIVPGADFTDPAWGVLDTPEFSVEFSMGEDATVRSFALHVRGTTVAGAFVADLLAHLGLSALDPQAPGGIFKASASQVSMERWRAFRDQACGDSAT